MSKILIITGGSRGIGEGIVNAYIERGWGIFSLSRSINNKLKGVNQIEIDLCNGDNIEQIFQSVFEKFEYNTIEYITLINNAGSIGEVNRIENIPETDIKATFQLNTIVPIQLSRLFIQKTKDWKARKSIINISSGAAVSSKYGWSIYCSSKAAIDLFTQSVALEQNFVENGVELKVVYPGIVDTAMQEKLRSQSKDSFMDVDKFIDFKTENKLNDISTVGKEVYKIDQDTSIQNGSIIRIQDNR